MPVRDNYRRRRAPQENGGRLVDPEWSQLPGIVASNRASLSLAEVQIGGRPLTELAIEARRELVQRATAYTRSYANHPVTIEPVSEKTQVSKGILPPIVLAGHQPELFHPGVWYKNFALSRLAKQTDSIAVNLIIDSDLCRQASLGVPTGSVDRPRIEQVAFDVAADSAVPYEERQILDRELFASFGSRVAKTIAPLVPEPMIKSLWPTIVHRSQQESNLGRCLAQGRHVCETRLLEQAALPPTLELPQSEVCGLSAFRVFVVHMLAHAAEFAVAHNQALADYRAAHSLRNRAHPVPDLLCDGDWIETPFWIWSAADPIRRPLFVRTTDTATLIGDRHNREVSLPGDLATNLAPNMDQTIDQAIEQLSALETNQIKIRSRALCTTLFARMFLGDLFVHGIGGAKYDEATDEIIRRFFHIDLPAYATVSATLRLPIQHSQTASDALSTIDQRLRDMTYHPEHFLKHFLDPRLESDELSNAHKLAQKKKQWISTAKTPANAKTRHDAITSLNQQLGNLLTDQRLRLEQQREQVQHQMRANTILESREYPFCLFPEDTLRPLLLDRDASRT